MLLSTGKIDPLCTDDRIHTLWEFFQNIIALRVMKDSQNFLTGSFRFSHTHIFQNGRLDETAVLKYERHRIHEFLFWDVFHINTTDFYHSALGIKESGNQVGKGCLTTAGRAYKSYRLPCRNGQ